MRIAVDTNVFAYAEGADDFGKTAAAKAMLLALAGDVIMPGQVAGELFNVLTRKFGWTGAAAAARIAVWREAVVFVAPTEADYIDAISLAARHGLQMWDSLIVNVAASADCVLLLSEDMQDGFVYRGVTVANPFAETLHPLLASLLESRPGALE